MLPADIDGPRRLSRAHQGGGGIRRGCRGKERAHKGSGRHTDQPQAMYQAISERNVEFAELMRDALSSGTSRPLVTLFPGEYQCIDVHGDARLVQ
jgi:hypothetical protein